MFAEVDVHADFLGGFFVDDGGEVGGGVFGGAEGEGVCCFDEAGEEGVVDVVEEDEAGAGGAFLAGVREGGVTDGEEGFVGVSGVVDDDGVFATHFADDFFDEGQSGTGDGGGLEDVEADGFGSGEGDGGDEGVSDECGADGFAGAGEEVEDVFGDAGLVEELAEGVGDGGGLLGGFEEDGVSGDEGGDGHAGGDGEGEVPGGDDGGGSAGGVEGVIGFASEVGEGLLGEEGLGLVGVVVAEVDGFADVGVGFGPGFSGFFADEGGELVAVLAQEGGGGLDDLAAGGLREVAPLVEGSLGALDGAIHLVDGCVVFDLGDGGVGESVGEGGPCVLLGEVSPGFVLEIQSAEFRIQNGWW